MSQIGESIAVSVFIEKKEDCWFCKEKPADAQVANKLDESPSSLGGGVDNAPENDVHNDSSTLGSALGNRPNWQVNVPGRNDAVPVVPGAHHLIPGNASYKRAPALHRWVEKSKGLLAGDIGYDVNGEGNGVWLPGSYGVRAGLNGFTVTWSGYAHQAAYAGAAMRSAAAQFHDSHPEYSGNVKGTLLSMAEKLDAKHEQRGPEKCPVCGEKVGKDGKLPPPFGLVRKLNAVSGAHRRMLKGPGVKPKVLAAGYFTSSRSKLLYR